MFEHATLIIRRVCQERGVPPEVVMGTLLEVLRSSAVTSAAASGYSDGTAANRGTVVDEIGSWARGFNNGEWPANTLAALDMFVGLQNTLAKLNAKNPKADDQHKAGQASNAKVMDCIQMILRQIINQADRHALESSIAIEAMAKQEGWKLNAPPQESGTELPDVASDPVELNRLINEVSDKPEGRVVLIESPEVLGNDYEDVMSNLKKLADANAALFIVQRDEQAE